ncbi:MAG: rod shape-determining protein MreC [Acidobacteria bacterium]|nr:rod shape-determining protein MreC [Acidobacteriota bacterium]
MALSRRNGRSRATLVFLVLTSMTVITLDFRGQDSGIIGDVRRVATDALAPVRDGADKVLSPVGNAFSGITDYGDLKDENARLRARIADLEGQRLRSADAEAERKALIELNGLDYLGNLPTVAARVVSAPVSNFEQTIELDRGTNHGVRTGMPVVTGAGLVGHVVEVSGRRSLVRLVSDPSSSVGVRLLPSGESGIADGEGPRRQLGVGFIATNAKVARGDLAFTSGLEGGSDLYPAGIPVGRVTSASSPPGELEQHVELRPAADLAHLRFVKVVKTKIRNGA